MSALSFSAAVFLAEYLLPLGLWLPAGAVCALLSLAALMLYGDRRRRALLIALGLAAGFFWTRGYDAVFFSPARGLDGRTVEVTADVTDWPRQTEYGASVRVRVRLPGAADQNAALYLDEKGMTLAPGDRIYTIAACRLADRTGSGEAIDYYTSRGIFLTAVSYGELEVERPKGVPLRYLPAHAVKGLADGVAAVFPPRAAPLMTTLLTGDTEGLDTSLFAALRRTGLTHVVVISGMHISFLSGLLMLLLGRRRRRATALLSLGVLFFFAMAVGGTPSVMRAVFQCACLQIAPILGREEDKPTTLSAVLAALLLQNPHAAKGAGLQLSFAAVAGIYLLAPPLYERWEKRLPKQRLPAALGRAFISTLSATLGAIAFTTPLAAWRFGAVSLIAPLSNLLALLAVSAAFMGGLAATVAGLFLPAAGRVLAAAASLPTGYLLWLVPALARVPFAAVELTSVYYSLWLLFVYTVLCLYIFWRGEKKRPLFPVGAAAAVFLAAVLFTRASFSAGGLTVSVLDVGQGQCVVLQSGGCAAVVDCGGTGPKNAGDIAADYFQNLGRGTLDLLVLTHYHADHAGGAEALMKRIKVRALALPDVEPEDKLRQITETCARAEGARLRYITEQATVELGEAVLTLYPPLGAGGGNEEGLAVLCSSGDFDVLITGDMGADIEARLIKYHDLPDLEVLVAGHHGSKYATSRELLAALTPEVAVISVGRDNTYGHPAKETLERLEGAGICVYRTDLSGAVTVLQRGP